MKKVRGALRRNASSYFFSLVGHSVPIYTRGVDVDKTNRKELLMQNPTPEYSKPAIADYGDLQKLTAANSTGTQTDVPSGTPVPPFSIFS